MCDAAAVAYPRNICGVNRNFTRPFIPIKNSSVFSVLLKPHALPLTLLGHRCATGLVLNITTVKAQGRGENIISRSGAVFRRVQRGKSDATRGLWFSDCSMRRSFTGENVNRKIERITPHTHLRRRSGAEEPSSCGSTFIGSLSPPLRRDDMPECTTAEGAGSANSPRAPPSPSRDATPRCSGGRWDVVGATCSEDMPKGSKSAGSGCSATMAHN